MTIKFHGCAMNFEFLTFVSDVFGLYERNTMSHIGYFSAQNLGFIFLLQEQ